MHHHDGNVARQATDKFLAERDYQMKTSKGAAAWETQRKAEWAKAKPEWVKKRNQDEHSQAAREIKRELGI